MASSRFSRAHWLVARLWRNVKSFAHFSIGLSAFCCSVVDDLYILWIPNPCPELGSAPAAGAAPSQPLRDCWGPCGGAVRLRFITCPFACSLSPCAVITRPAELIGWCRLEAGRVLRGLRGPGPGGPFLQGEGGQSGVGVLALPAQAISHQPLAGRTEGCVEAKPPLPPDEAKGAGVWTVA